MSAEPVLLPVPEAAALARISERLLWQRIRVRDITPRYIGRLCRIPAEELRRWLADLPTEAPR